MKFRKGKLSIILSVVSLLIIFVFSVCVNLPGAEAIINPPEPVVRNGITVSTVTDPQGNIHDRDTIYEKDDDTSIVTMHLTVMTGNPADNTDHTWADVNANSADWYDEHGLERYKAEGILTIGEKGSGESFGFDENASNCTVQIRGQTSSRRNLKNYKIRIKDGKGSWRSQRTIALNKHYGEPFRFVNKLNYDLIRKVPQLIGARTQFVHLYVKDLTKGEDAAFEDYGLYTQVEQMNKTYLENHGLDRYGHMYKVTFFEWDKYEAVMDAADPELYDEEAFAHYMEPKGSQNHKKLIDTIEKINDYKIPIDEIVENHFDAENLCYWMAFHILNGNYDAGARNLFLYSPLNSEKWYIITWDTDASFTHEYHDSTNHTEGQSWERGMSQFTGIRLFARMLKEQKYRDMLTNAIEDLRRTCFSEENLKSESEKLAATVRPFIKKESEKSRVSTEEFDRLVGLLPQEAANNYEYYFRTLNAPWPFFIGSSYNEDGKTCFTWDSSFDPNGEKLKYHISISEDAEGEKIVVQSDSYIPMFSTEHLKEGDYYLKMSVSNESGYTQDCFDYYNLHGKGKIYGTVRLRVKGGYSNEIIYDSKVQ